MGNLNIGYLSSESSPESDECYTPRLAIEPLIKYLKKKGFKKIWCPFDKEHSMFVRVLKQHDFEVHYTHIETGDDFFFFPYSYANQFDCIVSNPPFSIKDEVLQRCYNFDISFALLLPQNSLQSSERVSMFLQYGLEYLGFNLRVPYYTPNNMIELPSGNHFASGYFCHRVLEEKLIFEKLTMIQEGYYDYPYDIEKG